MQTTDTAPTAPETRVLPLWLCELRHEDDGTPVHAACVAADVAHAANAPWAVQAANAPEEDDGTLGLWLLPLADGAAAVLGVDARVWTAGGVVVVDVVDAA